MNKYNAKPVVIDGIRFDSIAEGDCYLFLKTLERAGEIDKIECHVVTRFPIKGLTHKTDFKYFDIRQCETVWAEYKGRDDQRWRDIKKIWKFCGPGRLKIFKGRGLRIACVEEIIPEKREET